MTISVEKVSIALGKEELEWARQKAEREGTSVSAILTEAVRAARKQEAAEAKRDVAWQEYLTWATQGDGLAEDELAAAEKELK